MLTWISVFLLVAILFLAVSFLASYLLKKLRNIPWQGTSLDYECGELPHTRPKVPFKPSFLIIGLIFIVFETEILFIFPWSLQAERSFSTIFKGIFFLFVLASPLILFFKWQVLDWEKTRKKKTPEFPSEYSEFNKNPWYENRR